MSTSVQKNKISAGILTKTKHSTRFHYTFSLVLKKANKWLKRHPEYKLKKVQTLDVPVPYTSLNLNPNTASTDYYIDHGSKFYSRTLR